MKTYVFPTVIPAQAGIQIRREQEKWIPIKALGNSNKSILTLFYFVILP